MSLRLLDLYADSAFALANWTFLLVSYSLLHGK